jgi:hypothetical protein
MDIVGHARMTPTAGLGDLVVPAAHREVADVIDQSPRPKIQETASDQGLFWG